MEANHNLRSGTPRSAWNKPGKRMAAKRLFQVCQPGRVTLKSAVGDSVLGTLQQLSSCLGEISLVLTQLTS